MNNINSKIKIKQNKKTQLIITSVIIFIILVAIFLFNFFVSEEFMEANFMDKKLPPSLKYPFGTDWLGRNMFYRTIKGLSLSIIIGTISSFVSSIIATIIGVLAAISSKKIDIIINWVIDLVMGIPHLILLILISFAFNRGMKGLLIGIAVTHWTSLARLIRAEVLQIRNKQYIVISRNLGHNNFWIIKNHILPHLVPQFIIGLILLFPHAILHESSLSFLGYGLPPEYPAIGIILSESIKYLTSGMWWLAFFPGLALVIIVLLFDRLGNNLKALLNPNN